MVTPPLVRSKIITHYEDGMKIKEIAQIVNVPRRTVSDIIKRFNETGSLNVKPKHGRPSKITKSIGKYILRDINKSRDKTSIELKHEISD